MSCRQTDAFGLLKALADLCSRNTIFMNNINDYASIKQTECLNAGFNITMQC